MIWFVVVAMSLLCVAAAARWGIIGAIGSYIAVPIMMVAGAAINFTVSEHGVATFKQDLEIIEYGLAFYLASLWYLPLPGIAFGLAIYWMRRARPRTSAPA